VLQYVRAEGPVEFVCNNLNGVSKRTLIKWLEEDGSSVSRAGIVYI
jgi:hypothetical protein